MTRVWICVTTVFGLLSLGGGAFGQVFSDGLDTGTGWTIAQDADASAVFGFDYSTKGLPAAPRGSDTIGLKLEVNNSQPTGAAEIGAFFFDSAFTGQYTLRVDVWSNWAPDDGGVGTGTTEFVGVSVGHDGAMPGPLGASFLYTGDGDAAATDYRLYKEETQLQSESGQYALGDMAGARDHTNPIIQAAFPEIDIATAVPAQGSTGLVRAGAAGFQWMTVNVEVDTENLGPSGDTTSPGFARFTMRSASSGNTLEIGTVDYSNGEPEEAFLDGSIGLLMSDLFSSVTVDPAFSFSVFDNVEVFDGLVPLPADPLAGDYNSDGMVDAADYTVWRDGFGTEFTLSDYDVWANNFGATAPGASTSIPEPAVSLLAGVAIAAGCCSRRLTRKT
ncbi:MAG: hypothetical protein AAGJ46_04585 [Planctomycetota bacterium]